MALLVMMIVVIAFAIGFVVATVLAIAIEDKSDRRKNECKRGR